jgi:hypothetical protein
MNTMKSPFPGMDPYLELRWQDVHHRLINYACDLIGSDLPLDLVARVQERAYIEMEEGQIVINPDVQVVEHREIELNGAESSQGGVAVAEPIVVRISREPIRQGYITIVDTAKKNRVVTVIEFVSPTNKLPGDGRKLYRKKQKEVIKAGVNLVEIDLTRAGKRTLAVLESQLRPSKRATYLACVTRGGRDEAEVYPLRITEPLPSLRIPLRRKDPDAILPLQLLLDKCYEKGRYYTIDYSRPLKPAFDAETAKWAEKLLHKKRDQEVPAANPLEIPLNSV